MSYMRICNTFCFYALRPFCNRFFKKWWTLVSNETYFYTTETEKSSLFKWFIDQTISVTHLLICCAICSSVTFSKCKDWMGNLVRHLFSRCIFNRQRMSESFLVCSSLLNDNLWNAMKSLFSQTESYRTRTIKSWAKLIFYTSF